MTVGKLRALTANPAVQAPGRVRFVLRTDAGPVELEAVSCVVPPVDRDGDGKPVILPGMVIELRPAGASDE